MKRSEFKEDIKDINEVKEKYEKMSKDIGFVGKLGYHRLLTDAVGDILNLVNHSIFQSERLQEQEKESERLVEILYDVQVKVSSIKKGKVVIDELWEEV